MAPASITIKDAMPEDRLLFGCMRQDLAPDEARALVDSLDAQAVDWDAVHDIATRHGVAPLVYVNLRKCIKQGLTVPDEPMARFRHAMFHALKENEHNSRWLEKVLTFFNDHDIDVMLLKGAALDVAVYDPPWHVTALDIDLLVRPEADQVPEDTLATIWGFNGQGPFECNFGTHHDLCIDGLLSIDYDEVWRDAKQVDVLGRRAYIMCPEDLLITCCINGCRKRYFQLKNLYGIRETVAKFRNLDWRRVADKAARYDCTLIVYAALVAAQRTVACDVPGDVFERLNVGAVRSGMIRFLVRRMSYASLIDRSVMSEDQTRLREKKLLTRSNLSLLLPYASYRVGQSYRRLKWLSRKEAG